MLQVPAESDRHSSTFRAAGEPVQLDDRTHSQLHDDQIMEDRQFPVMRAVKSLEDCKEGVANSTTFAQHFLEIPCSHLNESGRFSHLTNGIDSFGRQHQRSIFHHFSAFRLEVPTHLRTPEDSRDARRAGQTVMVGVDK